MYQGTFKWEWDAPCNHVHQREHLPFFPTQGGNCEIPGKSDAEDFQRLLNAMEILQFSSDDQDSIFRILASILHLGNVYFEKYEVSSAPQRKGPQMQAMGCLPFMAAGLLQ